MGFRERNRRVHIRPTNSTDMHTMENLFRVFVSPQATVYTDQHGGYRLLKQRYEHRVISHSKGSPWAIGNTHTNSIESVWAVFKRGYHGVYHQWSPKHTHRYGNEFAFRLTHPDIVEAIDKIINGAFGKRLTYEGLTSE